MPLIRPYPGGQATQPGVPPPALPVTLPETVPPGHSGEVLPYPILRRLSSTSESRGAPGASALRRGGGVILGAREEPEPPAGSAGGAGGGAAMPPQPSKNRLSHVFPCRTPLTPSLPLSRASCRGRAAPGVGARRRGCRSARGTRAEFWTGCGRRQEVLGGVRPGWQRQKAV